MAGEGRVAGPHRAGLAGSRQEAAVRQSRRQAARGFYRHGRSLRRLYRLHQGALPIAAALFHRLSGGDETRRRLADCLEIVSLRREAIAHPDSAALTTPPVRAHWTGTGIAHGGSEIPSPSDSAGRAGGRRAIRSTVCSWPPLTLPS